MGQINQVIVLTAQQAYLNALIAVSTRLADTAALFMALGGGWPQACTNSL